MYSKGRGKNKNYAKGDRVNGSKLNESSVLKIRESLKQGHSVSSVARTFKVTRANIRMIRDKKTWKHVICLVK
jgi:hypothetical protein